MRAIPPRRMRCYASPVIPTRRTASQMLTVLLVSSLTGSIGFSQEVEDGPGSREDAAAPPAPFASLDPYRLGDGLRGTLGPISLRLRTRIHADLVAPDFDDLGAAYGTDFGTVTDIRRARALLDMRGTEASGFEDLRFRAQVDFADFNVRWLDLYARYDGVPTFGPIEESNVRAGHFREPFGLEAMTSVTYLPFIERSTATIAFTPGRSHGAQVSARTSSALFQLGAFRRADGLPFPDELQNERAITTRAVWQGAGDGLVQAGGSLSFRDPNGELLIFRARTGTRFLDRLVDTDRIEADAATVAGLEALFQRGRWTAQTECFGLWIDGANGVPGESFLSGAYVSLSTFLGESSTRWNRMRGALGAPSVEDAWSSGGSWSNNVEAVARVSWTDLNDGSVRGGKVVDIEAGFNFYLTSTTRLMVHWLGVRADNPDGISATGHALLGRIQIQI